MVGVSAKVMSEEGKMEVHHKSTTSTTVLAVPPGFQYL